MEHHVAKWMFVTDALRTYVTTRGVGHIPAHGRAEIIEVIGREIASTRALLGHVGPHERSQVQGEIVGAASFLHAFRQADEGLPAYP